MNKLNSKIWDKDNNLQEDIRKKLLQISKIFLKDVETPIEIKNIFLTGSLASYQWRATSDFDLHIIVNVTDEECMDTALDYFDTKSKIFNKEHEIFIKGYKVEVNLKTEENVLKDKGIYDIVNKEWLALPKEPKRDIDDPEVSEHAEKIKRMIDKAIANDADMEELKMIRNQIKDLRAKGLEDVGEYSVGNMVFKKLRHDNYIKKLYDYKAKVENEKLSLEQFSFQYL